MSRKPWEAEGISRSKWYKNKRIARTGVEESTKVTASGTENCGKTTKPWQFQPGICANPGGRPKIAKNIRELARGHTETALRALIEVAEDKSHPQRVSAANSLLDRGYGKPLQQIETGGPGAFAEMSEEELTAFIEQTRQQIEEIGHIEAVH